MKKSALTFLLVTALLGSLLTACSGNNNGNNAGTPTATNPPVASETPGAGSSPSAEPEQPDNSAKPDENPSASSTDKIVSSMLEKIEQPSLIDLAPEELKNYYGFDPELVEEFTIKTPAFNLMSNEIAVIKVKDIKDIEAVKKGMEKRAEDVQKMFEQYLPEPYKHAQNYKIEAKGEYVLFLISESANDLVKAFKEIAA